MRHRLLGHTGSCVRLGSAPRFLFLAAAWTLLAPRPANATLGEPETTAVADASILHGSIKSADKSNYRVREIALPSGTVLREFASPGGAIFAVAWSGPSMPNFQQALGAYFETYRSSAAAPHHGHHHLDVSQAGFAMHSEGHMRAFSGRAYLPQALPAGVSPDELY